MENKPQARPLPTRIVSIDFGMARLGIAISDEQKIIAMPLMTLHVEPKTELTVAKLLRDLEKHQQLNRYTIEAFVVGMPLLMSGKVGLLADETTNFINKLKEVTSIPIITWDERLTTVMAERSMCEGTMSRKKRSKIVDKVAAVIILQNYLDSRTFKHD
jgi:putative holliday junction resolvase